ncbi:SMI1/KNR4 family protein [Apibacter mensalis]|uniref:SMI1/KNR4 family protein n=1 Tax=Apibacter mensalis TaxID=1586267 RepID=UPI0026EBD2AE|nr:SMI1/KNR4 family protein [Apibacter mensalis]
MNRELYNRINIFFSKEENQIFRGNPVSDEEIDKAQKELHVKFVQDYIDFLKNFGGSYVGVPIYGFNNSQMLSSQTVVDITNEFRENYKQDNRCPIIQESYVISITGSGDPVMVIPSGEILIYYHDSDSQEIYSQSFSELIEKNL